MTPAQIESAARELCRLRGLDPDRSSCASAFDAPEATWKNLADEVARFAQIGTAIAHALAVPQKTPTQRKKSGTPK